MRDRVRAGVCMCMCVCVCVCVRAYMHACYLPTLIEIVDADIYVLYSYILKKVPGLIIYSSSLNEGIDSQFGTVIQ